MKTKATSLLLGVGLAALLSVPVLADTAKAKVKAVDADANTLTLTSHKKDMTVGINSDTHFLDKKGKDLADGIKDPMLMPGASVSVTYTKTGDTTLASEVKIKSAAKMPKAPKATATTTTAP